MTEAGAALALQGELTHFFPSEVLQLLQLAQATGGLVLERPGEQAELYVERGRPVFARTTGSSVRTGQILVHRGVVSADALEHALAEQRSRPGPRIGALLIAAGVATQEQVQSAVNEALRRVVYGLLLWREGTFHFRPGEQSGSQDVKLDLDLDRLILEGLRQADEARAG
ncbi:MAG TPA: DUF4388 domain-containing protein [Candidatus Eisenbacteria bacterium]|nr:DUF4388 domain-containing protein [Candidatus Eisenbacteria bacterium]